MNVNMPPPRRIKSELPSRYVPTDFGFPFPGFPELGKRNIHPADRRPKSLPAPGNLSKRHELRNPTSGPDLGQEGNYPFGELSEQLAPGRVLAALAMLDVRPL